MVIFKVLLLWITFSAVAFDLALSRPQALDNSPRTFEEIYFPKGYKGSGLNGPISSEYRDTKYDRLVAFGSSYGDNAHPRDEQYNISYAGAGYWQKRWSDGPVWTEYFAGLLGPDVAHLNYAYGGATTNNSIHPTGVPDTGSQMQQYMQEYPPGSQKALVALFTTTNDITYTFKNYVNKTNPIYRDLPAALVEIEQSSVSLFRQLSDMVTASRSGIAPDFLILPILPVELSPTAAKLAQENNVSLNVMYRITQRYNDCLMRGALELAKRLHNAGQVFTYDVPALFYSMVKYPLGYNLTDVTNGCLGKSICAHSATYLWWDGMHLTTTMQQRLARMSANVVLNQAVMP